MSPTSSLSVSTSTLSVPGAELYYEVRGAGPLLVLVGAPMDAASFAPVADLLATDYTVLTSDPRGSATARSRIPISDCTPEMRADDLSRLLAHLDAGPAAVLGSSGAAVSVLALVQDHPEQVHTVIAHEPPLDELLARPGPAAHPDRGDDRQLPLRRHPGGLGAVPGHRQHPAARRGVRDDVRRAAGGPTAADEYYQFAHMLRGTTRWQPDLDRLRTVSTRSWSASAKSPPASSAIARRAPWPRAWTSSPPFSRATTSGSWGFPMPSPPGCVRSSPHDRRSAAGRQLHGADPEGRRVRHLPRTARSSTTCSAPDGPSRSPARSTTSPLPRP